MKRLTVEEKAKAYDKAFEIAKSKIRNNKDHVLYEDDIIGMFPELKESEDEMVWLTKYLQEEIDCLHYDIRDYKDSTKLDNLQRALAWVEKQGEQKPTDKVEPKFKVGDWVVNNNGEPQLSQVTARSFPDSKIKGAEGNLESFINTATLDKQYHLWTISDAKDGDVLATLDYILIFEKFLPKDGGLSYCHYDFGCSRPQFIFNKDGNWHFGKEAKVYPATKEQRDLLFQKMKEAGYEWDAEKKELRKVEQKPADTEKGSKRNDREIPNSAWSEEDEQIYNRIYDLIHAAAYANCDIDEDGKELGGYAKMTNWFKSLKNRVQVLPQNNWKPTDEQMKLLREVQQALLGKDCHNRFVNFMCELKRLRED